MTRRFRAAIVLAAWWVAGTTMFPALGEALDLSNAKSLLPEDLVSGNILGGPVTLSAERLSYDEMTGVAEAEGNVEVGFGGRVIRADRIRYDAKSGEAEFVGSVRYEDDGEGFSFDRIVLNIRTELGVLYNGSILIRSNNYRITSERFEKTGPKSFSVRKGTLTTCPCDDEPDWKFKVGRSSLTLDGYAVAKDVTFHVKGVPVAWLPWGAFPVKLSRQSGILIPSFSQSPSRGYSFQLPLYWAISRWSDATLTLDAMTRRGLRPEMEYRFVLNSASEATANVSLFRDKVQEDTRYRINGSNRFRFGEDFVSNAKWDIRSDDQYYEDLVEEDLLRTGRHSASRGFAALQGSRSVQALAVAWVQDNQGTPDDNTVQRLPEYTMTLIPRGLWGSRIEASGDLSATWFYRTYGDREVRGRGAVELARSFELFPSVSFTPFLAVDLYGSVPTSDKTGTETAGRAVPTGGATLAMFFRRDYSSSQGTRYHHQVSPVAEFRWIPKVDQSRIALVDYASRIQPQSQFHVGLNQRLIRAGEKGPSEIAFLELSWAVDVRKRSESDSPYVDPYSPFVRNLRDQIDLVPGGSGPERNASSDLYGRFSFLPAAGWRLSGEALFDPTERQSTMSSTGAEYRKDPDNGILLEYRVTKGLSEDLRGEIEYRPFWFLGLQTKGNYSIRNAEMTDGSAGVTLHPRSDCWSLGVVANRRTRPDETSFKLVFSLKGIGSIGK